MSEHHCSLVRSLLAMSGRVEDTRQLIAECREALARLDTDLREMQAERAEHDRRMAADWRQLEAEREAHGREVERFRRQREQEDQRRQRGESRQGEHDERHLSPRLTPTPTPTQDLVALSTHAYENPVLRRYSYHLLRRPPDPVSPFQQVFLKPGPEFYASLHYPWNVEPGPRAPEITDLSDLYALAPKFGGDPALYASWRGFFIPCVHLADTYVGWKAVALMNSLDKDCPELEDIVDGFSYPTPDNYARAITRLERIFGYHPIRRNYY